MRWRGGGGGGGAKFTKANIKLIVTNDSSIREQKQQK